MSQVQAGLPEIMMSIMSVATFGVLLYALYTGVFRHAAAAVLVHALGPLVGLAGIWLQLCALHGTPGIPLRRNPSLWESDRQQCPSATGTNMLIVNVPWSSLFLLRVDLIILST